MRQLSSCTVSPVKVSRCAVEVDPVTVVLVDAIVTGSVSKPRRRRAMSQAVYPEFRCVSACTVSAIVVQLWTVEVVSFVRIIAESVPDPQRVGTETVAVVLLFCSALFFARH